MSAMLSVFSVIGAVAARIGAPIIKQVLQNHVGSVEGSLAAAVVDEVAQRIGVPVNQLHQVEEDDLGLAVRGVESNMPQVIALWQKGLEGQFAMAEADSNAGGLAAAWRWGWMYLLGFFWVCAFLIFPLSKSLGVEVDPIDVGTLMTLTGWFISLYMGGHTVKVLGRQALDAARTWRKGGGV